MTRSPRRITALTLAISLSVLLLVGCGGDDDSDLTATQASDTTGDIAVPATADRSAAVRAMCEAWSSEAAYDGTEAGEADMNALIAAAVPDDLADEVALAIALDQRDKEARAAGEETEPPSQEDEAAVNRVLVWMQDACAGAVVKVAPPLVDLPEGWAVCNASATPPTDGYDDPTGRAAVYAPASAADPYAGAVVALLWGPESHAGDGETTPVTVRGTEGVVAPITAFQQVVLEELGSVVAWTEGDVSFGLYGRGWDLSRADELVAMADAVTADGDGYAVATSALPAGFETVYTGPSDASMLPGTGDFSVSLMSTRAVDADDQAVDQSLITISGSTGSPGSDELWRIFALESERTTIGDRQVSFSTAAWGPTGPVFASWREDAEHHVIVTAVGTGAASEADVVRDLVTASRPLNSEEWTELANAAIGCGS